MSASMTRPRDEPAIHPGVDLPLLHDLIRPERSPWTPSELRHLTSTIAAELTVPLLEVARSIPEQRRPVRLALTDGVELWLLSWRPGEDTGPHDHGGAYGSFTVLLGELTEDFTEDYRYLGCPSRSALHGVGAAVGFGPKRAHRMRNLGTRETASVHAYSPPLLPTRQYVSRADGLAGATPRLPTGQSARRRWTRCSRKHAQS
ncbi:MAG: cysteine dioxygenase [Egibacteraceae bacterium]